MPDYIRPVQPVNGRMSSWSAHQRRSPRSTEPGTDYYVPIGTPVVAPRAGVVQMTGDSIAPATGRFVYILFDRDSAGRLTSGRALHLSRRTVKVGDRVKQGQIIGYSGASGYGKEDWSSDPSTGGAHVHWTFWLSHSMRFGYDSSGRPYTVDFENYVSGSPAGGTGDDDIPEEVFDMAEMVIVTEKNNNGQPLSDKDRRAAFVNTESGFSCDFSWLTLADADRWAKQVGMPAGAVRLSDAGFDKFLGRLATVRG